MTNVNTNAKQGLQVYPNRVNALWRLHLPMSGMSFERDDAMGEMLSLYDIENDGQCVGTRAYIPRRDFFDQCIWLVREAEEDETLTPDAADAIVAEIVGLRYGLATG